jgi:ABC-type Mn2+/Zn2+ transport system ATPase subunit
MSEPALIRTEDAAFGAGARGVVQGVTLEIVRGDCVALVGPNGSGKTTLLRGLLGLLPPLSGRVIRRPGLRLGYVPQRETLDPLYPLSGLDVALLGTYGDVPPWRRLGARERGRAREALDACRALPLARRRYGELSGGERQRVLLARAVASEPDLLLLDEPTAGIDNAAEVAILDALDEIRRRRPVAIWIVTHHLDALHGRVGRVATITDGRLRIGEAA